MARNWFRTLVARSAARKRRPQSVRPRLEMLEDRRVLATLTVMNGDDSGAGSLREAVDLANANPDHDTIEFAAGVTVVTLTTDQLTLSSDMTIAGPTGGTVTVARSATVGTPEFRIFDVPGGVSVELSNLKITGGHVADFEVGGGIYNSGALTIDSSTVSGNSAFAGGGIFNLGTLEVSRSNITSNLAIESSGGGIRNTFGPLAIISSTISGNSAFVGGGVDNFKGTLTVVASTLSGNSASTGGGINNFEGSVTVTSSTLSGNSATLDGGAVYSTFGSLSVASSTISGNLAPADATGGIRSAIVVPGATTLTNTIVANSTGSDLRQNGGPIVGSNNLIEESHGDPLLGPLADNGGPTLTHALLPGSIAIDAGVNLLGVISDQRHYARPAGGFDIGAYETGSAGLLVTTGDDTTDPSDGLISLREAVAFANTLNGVDTIVFASDVTTVTLTSDQLFLANRMKIAGPANGTVTVARSAAPGTPEFRIFQTWLGSEVELANLTITGGRSLAHGGAVAASGPLKITSSTITGNSAATNGGAIYGGSLTITSSTISGNSAGGDGGGIYHPAFNANVTSSIISGNSAGGDGGGIYHSSFKLNVASSIVSGNSAGGNGGGMYVVQDEVFASLTTFSENTAKRGGGIYLSENGPYVWTGHSTFDSNSVSSEGGAIHLGSGTFESAFNTFSNNSAVSSGGAVSVYGGGTAKFVFSTLSGNSSGFNGGAIYNNGGTAALVSSTLSGNSAQYGGAIGNAHTLKVDSSTVTGNSATGYGGGITNLFGPATLNNTIVANSIGGDLVDATSFGGQPFDGSGNLIEDGSGGAGLGKITGDPNLGPLADNGGYTLTHLPLPGSIAIHAGIDALAAGAFFDQRSFSRFVGTIDIGAVEVQPITLEASTVTAVPGLPVTFTATPEDGLTGTITFKDGTTVLGTVPIVDGVATLTVEFETYGSHVVSASHTAALDATVSVSVVPAASLPDPLNPGENALFVGGTAGSDVIGVDRHGNDRYKVGILSFPSGSWWPSLWGGTFNGSFSRVVVYGGDGSDGIAVDKNLKADAWLYGGEGNDVIIGGGGNDLLMGGAGNDVLTARGGRDILIGGTGADNLFGGTGGDLLIAGSTAFDLDEEALISIQREWTSNRDLDTRVKNLRGTGTGARENGNNFLKTSGPGATMLNDGSDDDLTGGSGRDWFFANRIGSGVRDDIHGLKWSDLVDDLL